MAKRRCLEPEARSLNALNARRPSGRIRRGRIFGIIRIFLPRDNTGKALEPKPDIEIWGGWSSLVAGATSLLQKVRKEGQSRISAVHACRRNKEASRQETETATHLDGVGELLKLALGTEEGTELEVGRTLRQRKARGRKVRVRRRCRARVGDERKGTKFPTTSSGDEPGRMSEEEARGEEKGTRERGMSDRCLKGQADGRTRATRALRPPSARASSRHFYVHASW